MKINHKKHTDEKKIFCVRYKRLLNECGIFFTKKIHMMKFI